MEKEEREELKESFETRIKLAIIEHINEKHNNKNDLSGGYKVLLIVAGVLSIIATLIAIIGSLSL